MFEKKAILTMCCTGTSMLCTKVAKSRNFSAQPRFPRSADGYTRRPVSTDDKRTASRPAYRGCEQQACSPALMGSACATPIMAVEQECGISFRGCHPSRYATFCSQPRYR